MVSATSSRAGSQFRALDFMTYDLFNDFTCYLASRPLVNAFLFYLRSTTSDNRRRIDTAINPAMMENVSFGFVSA
jgi:hypothetical protein